MLYYLNRSNNNQVPLQTRISNTTIKDKSMHYYFRFLSVAFVLCMFTACVKYSFFNKFTAPYQLGVSYYQNGSYQVQSFISPDKWKQQKNNIWMGTLHTFHVQATLSDQSKSVTYDQKGFYPAYDYFEMQINPFKRQSYPSELIILIHGSHNNPGKLKFYQKYQGGIQFVHLSADHFKLTDVVVDEMRIGQEIIDTSGTRFPVIHLFVSSKQSSDLNVLQSKPQAAIPEYDDLKPVQETLIEEETLSPDSNISQDIPLYRLGFQSSFDHAHIAGSILHTEWKAYGDYYEARLFTFKVSILSQDRKIQNFYKQKGFVYKSSRINDSFIADLNHSETNSVPLVVRVYGFSTLPPSLKFFQKLKGKSPFFELKKDSFIIENYVLEKLEIAQKIQISGKYCPLVNLHYHQHIYRPQVIQQQPPIDENLVTITTIIEGYELISLSIKELAYLEFISNNVIVATSPVNQREISYTFASDKVPDIVQLSTRQNKIQAKKIDFQRYMLSLKPYIREIIITNHIGQPISQAAVHIYANRKRQVYLQNTRSSSFFNRFFRLFSKPSESYITEKITLYSGKTNKNGIASFVDPGFPLNYMYADIAKIGYQVKENIPIAFPLQIRLEPRTKMLQTIHFKYAACMNESVHIHQSGGVLEIYDQGQLLASLTPEDNMILPFVKNPVYQFKNPEYLYHDIRIDPSGYQFTIVPKARIQRPQAQVQVLIIMDVTDDDPRGVAFLQIKNALVRYLNDIQWDTLPADKKHQIKVASAYQDYLNYFTDTGEIDNNILMIQADCSLTEQIKKAFAQFDSQLQGKKKVIYIISSRRASVIVDDNLIHRINTDQLIQDHKIFSGIVVGEYGGKGFRKLSQLTSGQFSYCKTSDEIYSRLNDIVGSLTNESQIISCSNHP